MINDNTRGMFKFLKMFLFHEGKYNHKHGSCWNCIASHFGSLWFHRNQESCLCKKCAVAAAEIANSIPILFDSSQKRRGGWATWGGGEEVGERQTDRETRTELVRALELESETDTERERGKQTEKGKTRENALGLGGERRTDRRQRQSEWGH